MGGFVERSVRVAGISWELLDILRDLVLQTDSTVGANVCPSSRQTDELNNKMHASESLFRRRCRNAPSILQNAVLYCYFMKDRHRTIS
jgi:hypothetical protein